MNNPCIVYFQPSGEILSVDSRFEEVFGYHSNEIAGRQLEDALIAAESRELYLAMYKGFLDYTIPDLADIFNFFLLTTKNGEMLHARADANVHISGKNVLYVLHLYATSLSSCTLTFDISGAIINCTNPTIFGYPMHDAVHVGLEDLIPDLRSSSSDYRHLKDQQLSLRHLYGRHSDGSTFPVSMRVGSFGFGEGATLFRGTVFKLSDAVQAVFQLDSCGFILDCNKQVPFIFEYQRAELLGKSLACLFAEDQCCSPRKRKQFQWDNGYEDVLRMVTKSGNEVFVNCICFTHSGDDYVVRFSLFDVGQKLGPYIVGDVISQGSFGVVKTAHHSKTKKRVAVKILNKEEQSKALHKREMDILRSLSHPNIVHLLDTYETKDKVYIVTDFVQGDLLRDHVKKPMDPERAKFIFRQVTSAIQYCHRLNVFHRDINPCNIFVGPKDEVKLIDFGLSSIAVKDSFQSTFCGSPAFAAPEIIFGLKYNGMAVDVWSLGVLLHLMMTSLLPFQEVNMLMNLHFEPPPSLDPCCSDLLQNMLRSEPSQRFTIDHVVSHCWLKQNKM